MSEVKRWSIVPYDQYSVDERTSRNGEWVKWEDYEALAAERDRLVAENARLRAALQCLLRFAENTESELGIVLGSADLARAVLQGDSHE